MRRARTGLLALLAAACAAPPTPLGKAGDVEGNVVLDPGLRGDAYLFLYAPGEGPPLRQAEPIHATGVSDSRLAAGDAHFVFGQVLPNPYHLWGFLNAGRDFAAGIDVLEQPRAGDRVSVGADLNLEPGQALSVDVPMGTLLPHEPPAFSVSGADPSQVLTLSDQVGAVSTFDLVSSVLDTSFIVSLPDPGDPNAGTTSALGIPNLYPEVFLRFLPRPGQTVPLDPRGEPEDVIVPLTFDPAPFLVALNGDPRAEVSVESLQVVVVPQAQAIRYAPEVGRVLTAMTAIPVGDYELWVVEKSGQFWRLPNDLGRDGGTQSQHFLFSHALPTDAGL